MPCMLVDDLQKLTDEYVTDVNSTLTPKLLWRPFIEMLYKDVDSLDLNSKDKIMIGDLEYLKDIALVLSTCEEEELGEFLAFVEFEQQQRWIPEFDRVCSFQRPISGGW